MGDNLKTLSLKYNLKNNLNKKIYFLLFLLYIFICSLLCVYFYYDYKLNLANDDGKYILASSTNKEVFNNKVLNEKECVEYQKTFCKIPINRYSEENITKYLKESKIEYSIYNDTVKQKQFKHIKDILFYASIIIDILIYILVINMIRKKLENEIKTKYILYSLGYNKKNIRYFDNLVIIIIFLIYIVVVEIIFLVFSLLTKNILFYKEYIKIISFIYIVVLLKYFITYNIMLNIYNKTLNK